MQPCPGCGVAIGRAVVYYALTATHLVQELTIDTVAMSRYGQNHFADARWPVVCKWKGYSNSPC